MFSGVGAGGEANGWVSKWEGCGSFYSFIEALLVDRFVYLCAVRLPSASVTLGAVDEKSVVERDVMKRRMHDTALCITDEKSCSFVLLLHCGLPVCVSV